MTRPVTPTLTSVMQLAINNSLMDLHVALPCKVESYNVTEQTANLKPMIKRSIKKQNGTTQHESLPVIPNVPIAMPRFGDWFLSAPIAQGDFMFIVCSEKNMDQWRAKGTETESGELATHTLDGAVAFPCNLYPSDQALSSAHADNMVLGKDDGAQIHIKPNGEVHIYEENADQYVALGQTTDDRLLALEIKVNALITGFNLLLGAIDSHTHTGVMIGGGTTGSNSSSGASSISALAFGPSVQADKVKAT